MTLIKKILKILKSFSKIIEIIDLKYRRKGLMSFKQYWILAKTIERYSPCNLLIYGLGYDSILWNKLNKKGKTIFLEDNNEWIKNFSNSRLNIKQVRYNTKVQDYKLYGYDGDALKLDLDKEVKDTEWDMIIVDAPLGHQPPREWKGPGRMSSLYSAKLLSKNAKCIVVDDFFRRIEMLYALEYFGDEALSHVVEDKLAFFILNSSK
tara:strand:- start:117 stop:737 length:621 start_codon:yes stop_codon:yes gene_type:complete